MMSSGNDRSAEESPSTHIRVGILDLLLGQALAQPNAPSMAYSKLSHLLRHPAGVQPTLFASNLKQFELEQRSRRGGTFCDNPYQAPATGIQRACLYLAGGGYIYGFREGPSTYFQITPKGVDALLAIGIGNESPGLLEARSRLPQQKTSEEVISKWAARAASHCRARGPSLG